MFEQTKTGLAKGFLAIDLVSASKGGISALELQRQLGLGSDQTAWTWLHKLRRAMIRPHREPLGEQIEADETYLGGSEPGKRGRGCGRQDGGRRRGGARPRREAWRPAGAAARLAALPDASRASLEGFLADHVARPAAVTTDGWTGYGGLAGRGWQHEAIPLRTSWGDAALRLPAIHLVFSLAKRWLLGTHQGAVRPKHLPADLDEFVFRFNRRTARSLSHRFARLVEHAVQNPAHHLPRPDRHPASLTVMDSQSFLFAPIAKDGDKGADAGNAWCTHPPGPILDPGFNTRSRPLFTIH